MGDDLTYRVDNARELLIHNLRLFHHEGRHDRKHKIQHKIQEQNANYRLLDREREK